MIHLHKHRYEYMEEVNLGVLKHFSENKSADKMLVLDVGCGTGALSQAIQMKGYDVWGIELNSEASEIARSRINTLISADITDITRIKSIIGKQKFDYIVFSDVLEHIYDPFSLIKEYMSFLKDGGSVVVSVPNVLTWTNRIKFLFGVFRYQDTGIMDRTHVRFFTLGTLKELVRAVGLEITKVDYTPYFTRVLTPVIKKILLKGKDIQNTDRRQLIDSKSYKMYLKYVYPVEYALGYLLKSLFAFRIIVVGKK